MSNSEHSSAPGLIALPPTLSDRLGLVQKLLESVERQRRTSRVQRAPCALRCLSRGGDTPPAVQLHCRVGTARLAGRLPEAIPEHLCERRAPLFVAASDAVPLVVHDPRWLPLSFFSGSVSARAFSSSVQRRAFLQSVALSNALLSHQTARLSFSIAVFRSGPDFGPKTAAAFGVQISEPNG